MYGATYTYCLKGKYYIRCYAIKQLNYLNYMKATRQIFLMGLMSGHIQETSPNAVNACINIYAHHQLILNIISEIRMS